MSQKLKPTKLGLRLAVLKKLLMELFNNVLSTKEAIAWTAILLTVGFVAGRMTA